MKVLDICLKMNKFFSPFIPPIIPHLFRKIFAKQIQWVGEFETWNKASCRARGYDPNIYLDKLIETVNIVKNDSSKCERDSVLFDKIDYPYPLLSNLFAITSHCQAKSLYILDFGGSLGSLYFQNRNFLQMLPTYTWNILEQNEIIKAGKENFQTKELLFHSNFDEALSHVKIQDTKILILSSVLQYLENPYQILNLLLTTFDFDGIIIDRTPFSKDGKHHIVLQKIPQKIYKTQYPCHLFSKQELLNSIVGGGGYQLLDSFESYCDAHTTRFKSLGFSFIRSRQ